MKLKIAKAVDDDGGAYELQEHHADGEIVRVAGLDFFGPHGDDDAARATNPFHAWELFMDGWPCGESRRISGTITAVRIS